MGTRRLMQKDSGNALGREADFIANNLGNTQRMLNERLSIASQLTCKSLRRDIVSFPYKIASLFRIL